MKVPIPVIGDDESIDALLKREKEKGRKGGRETSSPPSPLIYSHQTIQTRYRYKEKNKKETTKKKQKKKKRNAPPHPTPSRRRSLYCPAFKQTTSSLVGAGGGYQSEPNPAIRLGYLVPRREPRPQARRDRPRLRSPWDVDLLISLRLDSSTSI